MMSLGKIASQLTPEVMKALNSAVRGVSTQLPPQSHEEIVAAYAVQSGLSIHEARKNLVMAGAAAMGLLGSAQAGAGGPGGLGNAMRQLNTSLKQALEQAAGNR